MRDQAQNRPSEAAADAFALWVLVDFAGYDVPAFPSGEATVDAQMLFESVEHGLTMPLK